MNRFLVLVGSLLFVGWIPASAGNAQWLAGRVSDGAGIVCAEDATGTHIHYRAWAYVQDGAMGKKPTTVVHEHPIGSVWVYVGCGDTSPLTVETAQDHARAKEIHEAERRWKACQIETVAQAGITVMKQLMAHENVTRDLNSDAESDAEVKRKCGPREYEWW